MHSKSIVHGDLKDENIVIDSHLNIRIIDFGAATLVCEDGISTKINRFQGTLNYIAPEVLKGGSFSGKPFDIWCCGILLYTMLTGEVPFANLNDIRNGNRRPMRVAVTPQATNLIDLLLHNDPDLRPKSNEIISHDWFIL